MAAERAPALGLVSLSNKTEQASTIISSQDAPLVRIRRMQRGVVAAARAINNALVDDGVTFGAALITLTYRPDVKWSSRHVATCLDLYRKWAKRKGFTLRYVWVLELQRNGKPHYHLILWLPTGMTPPKPDKQGWWPHGMTNCKWARSPVGYIAKYASKGTDGVLPKGARLFGHGGLNIHQRAEVVWSTAPRWLRRLVPRGHDIKRRLVAITDVGKYGKTRVMSETAWLDTTMGNTFLSPYVSDGFTHKGLIVRCLGYVEAWISGEHHKIPYSEKSPCSGLKSLAQW